MKYWDHMTTMEKIGQHLAVGFPGTEMTPEFLQFIKDYKIGNIILFARNIHDNKQLKKLCSEIRKHIYENTGIQPFITIDQEGGTVVRLSDDAANVPGEMAIAATGHSENAYKAGRITGRELRKLGVNVDLAPVMDVNSNINNPSVGVRAYADDPQTVAEFGCKMIKGLQDERIMACAKHFPGHGDTEVDSHLSLPCVDKSKEALLQTELYPFQKAIEAGVSAIMSTHILFPQLEKEKVPATMSHKILTGILREEFGFQGIIFSDCLEMNAIKDYYGTSQGALAALQAGVDIVLISHTQTAAEDAMNLIKTAVESGTLSEIELEKSTMRIVNYKNQYCDFSEPSKLALEEGKEDLEKAKSLYLKSMTIVQAEGPNSQIPNLGEKPFFISCPRYRASMVNNEIVSNYSFAKEMQKEFGGDALEITNTPTEEEIENALQQARNHSCIIIGTFFANDRKEQIQLVEQITKLNLPVIVIALGSPYDFIQMPPNVVGVCAWEYSKKSLQAISMILHKKAIPEGRLPIRLHR